MTLCIGVVILMLSVVTNAWSQCQPQYIQPLDSLDNLRSEECLFWEKTSTNRRACAGECFHSDHCVSFQYNIELLTCRAYPVGGAVLANLSLNTVSGYKTFVIEERDVGRWGSACVQDSNCNFENSECHSGQCRCNIGYAFNPKNSSCENGCAIYGDHYSIYQNSVISGNDIQEIPVDSFRACTELCNDDNKCKSFDFQLKNSICYVQHIGWLDVPVEKQMQLVEWAAGVRHCRD